LRFLFGRAGRKKTGDNECEDTIAGFAAFHGGGPESERGHLGDLVGRFQPVS
jgi:hypothetical protein